jgi:hypothetical protein
MLCVFFLYSENALSELEKMVEKTEFKKFISPLYQANKGKNIEGNHCSEDMRWNGLLSESTSCCDQHATQIDTTKLKKANLIK